MRFPLLFEFSRKLQPDHGVAYLEEAARGPRRTPTYSAQVAQAGLRNTQRRLRLGERQQLRSKDRNGLWWAELSSEIIELI